MQQKKEDEDGGGGKQLAEIEREERVSGWSVGCLDSCLVCWRACCFHAEENANPLWPPDTNRQKKIGEKEGGNEQTERERDLRQERGYAPLGKLRKKGQLTPTSSDRLRAMREKKARLSLTSLFSSFEMKMVMMICNGNPCH